MSMRANLILCLVIAAGCSSARTSFTTDPDATFTTDPDATTGSDGTAVDSGGTDSGRADTIGTDAAIADASTDDAAAAMDSASADATPIGPDGSVIIDARAADADRTCTGSGTRCGPSGGIEECVSGRWTLTMVCPFGCASSATCITSVTCTRGAYRCNGLGVEVCNATGTAWLRVSTCSTACADGLCVGACTPMASRCNAGAVEVCNAAGTAWDRTETCTTTCREGRCALASLDITTNRTLDGIIDVDGDVVVHRGATVTASTGLLEIRARTITVEEGGSIAAVPRGETAEGAGADSGASGGGGGGGHATMGASCSGAGGDVHGYRYSTLVEPGSKGGDAGSNRGGLGGGVIRLHAEEALTIAGQVTANGEGGQRGSSVGVGGGGSGGSILITSTRDLRVSGTIAAIGGAGYGTPCGRGGDGYLKLAAGGTVDTTGAVLSGVLATGLTPPFRVTSPTHPNQALAYNDGIDTAAFSWERPFNPIIGYYWAASMARTVPTPARGTFVSSELAAFPTTMNLAQGVNYFELAPVTASSMVGTMSGTFRVRVNTMPPTLRSMSHMSSATWSTNDDVFVSWTHPVTDGSMTGILYVFDHYGDTIPNETATFVPAGQTQQLLSDVAPGIWSFHAVSVDTMGYRTRTASHYVVRIGTNPGMGSVFGQVVNAMTSSPLRGVTVAVNRGIFPPQMTDSSGNFNITNVTAGTWDVTFSQPGFRSETRSVMTTAGGSTSVNVSLTPLPTS